MPVFTDPLWEVTYRWQYHERQCANVFHYRQSAPSGGTPAIDLLNAALATTVIPAIAGLQNENVFILPWYVQMLGPGPRQALVEQAGQTPSGVIGGPGLPGNVAICFTKRSTLAGRKYRGRFYLGGISEGHAEGNEWTGDGEVPASYALFLAAMRSTLAGIFVPCITGRVFDAGLTQWEGVDQSTFVLRNNRLDSQRGRLTGL